MSHRGQSWTPNNIEDARSEALAGEAAPGHRVGLGLGWRLGGSGAGSLELLFEAARRLPADDDPENRLGVNLTARWQGAMGAVRSCRVPFHEAAAGAGSGDATQFRRLLQAVSRAFLPCAPALPDAFFPAHLPVALIDAVFALPPACGAFPPQRFAGRYCRRFSLERVRPDPWNAPPAVDRRVTWTPIGFLTC